MSFEKKPERLKIFIASQFRSLPMFWSTMRNERNREDILARYRDLDKNSSRWYSYYVGRTKRIEEVPENRLRDRILACMAS